MIEISLPDGLVSRPLGLGDAHAVTELIAAQQLVDIGEVDIEEDDIVADWQRPSADLGADTLGVFDDERLVAYAEIWDADRGDAAVHPNYRGRGIGTTLAGWMQRRARESGRTVVGMPVPLGSGADRLLEELGYRVRWTSWELELPEGLSVAPRELPPGYRLREAEQDDLASCWTVLEDAFLEWSEREREPFGDFLARTTARPGFEPWHLRVVVDEHDAIVAVAVVRLFGDRGYVDRLATRRDQRGRGIAQALLVDAFAAATRHGATSSTLNTDSRTGALGLYQKVGMRVYRTWVNRAIDV